MKNYDDGNWNWQYECKYVDPSTDPKDWYYNIGFKTKKGGYLNGKEITCRYWQTKNKLEIIKEGSVIKFYVENFNDIKLILIPMIKAHKAEPYPLFESKTSIRKKKLIKIDKKS